MAVLGLLSIQAMERDLVDKGVWRLADSGAPTDGTSGTGVGFAGKGSTYTDTATGLIYVNTGTAASPVWS